MESYKEYGQNIFDRYVTFADYWIQDQEYRDPDTGEIIDRTAINNELEKIEKPAGISNPKDFRNEIVNLCGDLPRIELFARQKVKGWDSWGDEIDRN